MNMTWPCNLSPEVKGICARQRWVFSQDHAGLRYAQADHQFSAHGFNLEQNIGTPHR